MPWHHAWCLDDTGHVVETTWDKLGQSYVGHVFATTKVIDRVFGATLKPTETPSMLPESAAWAAWAVFTDATGTRSSR